MFAVAKDFGLLDDASGVIIEAVGVAVWAHNDRSADDRITAFTNFVGIWVSDDFSCGGSAFWRNRFFHGGMKKADPGDRSA